MTSSHWTEKIIITSSFMEVVIVGDVLCRLNISVLFFLIRFVHGSEYGQGEIFNYTI